MKNKNPYMFFCDLETTGFSPSRNDIIEFAAIVAIKKGNEYVALNKFHEFCMPYSRSNWTSGAEKYHKISYEQAMTFQHPRKMLIKLLKFLIPYKDENNEPVLFISHAKNKFDFKFVMNAFIKEGLQNSFYKVFSLERHESTIDLAEKYKCLTGLDSNKLDIVADYFNIEFEHHRALSDTEACFKIYKEFKDLSKGLLRNV